MIVLKYEEMDCGIDVELPDGRVGSVRSYEANFGLSLTGSSYTVDRPEKNLTARVVVNEDEDDEEVVEVKQHKLKKVD